MLDRTDVSLALAAAEAALEDEGSAWVKESALRERAYFWGLYNGLATLSEESAVAPILLRAVAETLFVRNGDDPFRASPLGLSLAALSEQFQRSHEGTPVDLTASVRALKDTLEQLDVQRQAARRPVERVLAQLEELADRALSNQADPTVAERVQDLRAELEPGLRLLDIPRSTAQLT